MELGFGTLQRARRLDKPFVKRRRETKRAWRHVHSAQALTCRLNGGTPYRRAATRGHRAGALTRTPRCSGTSASTGAGTTSTSTPPTSPAGPCAGSCSSARPGSPGHRDSVQERGAHVALLVLPLQLRPPTFPSRNPSAAELAGQGYPAEGMFTDFGNTPRRSTRHVPSRFIGLRRNSGTDHLLGHLWWHDEGPPR